MHVLRRVGNRFPYEGDKLLELDRLLANRFSSQWRELLQLYAHFASDIRRDEYAKQVENKVEWKPLSWKHENYTPAFQYFANFTHHVLNDMFLFPESVSYQETLDSRDEKLKDIAEGKERELDNLESRIDTTHPYTISRGYMGLAFDAAKNAFEVIDPRTKKSKLILLAANPWWYMATKPTTKDDSRSKKIKDRNDQMGDDAEAAIYGIPLHHIEIRSLLETKLVNMDKPEEDSGFLHKVEQDLDLDKEGPRQIVDMGTGDSPAKLLPIIDAVYSRYQKFDVNAEVKGKPKPVVYTESRPLEIFITDCNPTSLDEARKEIEKHFKENNNGDALKYIKIIGLANTFETLDGFRDRHKPDKKERWKDLNDSNITNYVGLDPSKRLVAFSGNTVWNVQNDPTYNLNFIPDGVALVSSHIMPDEDFKKLKPDSDEDLLNNVETGNTAQYTPLMNELAEAYSSVDVMKMGLGIIRALFKGELSSKDILDWFDNFGQKGAGVDSRDTMVLYKAKYNGHEELIVSALPTWKIDPYDASELGESRLLASKEGIDIDVRLGMLQSLKPTYYQARRLIGSKLLYPEKIISISSDKYKVDDNGGKVYNAGLVELFAFRSDEIKMMGDYDPSPSLMFSKN